MNKFYYHLMLRDTSCMSLQLLFSCFFLFQLGDSCSNSPYRSSFFTLSAKPKSNDCSHRLLPSSPRLCSPPLPHPFIHTPSISLATLALVHHHLLLAQSPAPFPPPHILPPRYEMLTLWLVSPGTGTECQAEWAQCIG